MLNCWYFQMYNYISVHLDGRKCSIWLCFMKVQLFWSWEGVAFGNWLLHYCTWKYTFLYISFLMHLGYQVDNPSKLRFEEKCHQFFSCCTVYLKRVQVILRGRKRIFSSQSMTVEMSWNVQGFFLVLKNCVEDPCGAWKDRNGDTQS